MVADYDAELDTLFVYFNDGPLPGVYDYVGGEVWVLYDPETLQVIGFQVENFEAVFLRKYAEVALLWQASQAAPSPASLEEVAYAVAEIGQRLIHGGPAVPVMRPA
jgi:uncharacterized protein YuzE